MREKMPAKQAGPDLLTDMQYEYRDVSFKKIMGWIAAFHVFFIVSMAGTAVIYWIFIPEWGRLGKLPEVSPFRKLPPHPQIQAEPRLEMAYFREAEDRQVSGAEGFIPGTQPAMTIPQAIEQLAREEGIAGLKGTAVSQRGKSYPGSRAFKGVGQELHADPGLTIPETEADTGKPLDGERKSDAADVDPDTENIPEATLPVGPGIRHAPVTGPSDPGH